VIEEDDGEELDEDEDGDGKKGKGKGKGKEKKGETNAPLFSTTLLPHEPCRSHGVQAWPEQCNTDGISIGWYVGIRQGC
jgi:hypothetical protein